MIFFVLLKIGSNLLLWAVVLYHARKMRKAKAVWPARFLLCMAIFSTLCTIAPNLTTFFVALAGYFGSIAAAVVSTWHWSREIKRDETYVKVLHWIADATAVPPTPTTHLAIPALTEAIENAVNYLKEVSPGKDYVVTGEGQRVVWSWSRIEENHAILDNLYALAYFSYAMCWLAASHAKLNQEVVSLNVKIYVPALLALIQFIAYNEACEKLLVAPVPYGQAEYRAAIEDAATSKLLQSPS